MTVLYVAAPTHRQSDSQHSGNYFWGKDNQTKGFGGLYGPIDGSTGGEPVRRQNACARPFFVS